MNREIEQLKAAIEGHGYFVTSEPIEGEEKQYAEYLRQALNKIENFIKIDAEIHHFRGLSKRALTSLHKAIPEPGWAIEVK